MDGDKCRLNFTYINNGDADSDNRETEEEDDGNDGDGNATAAHSLPYIVLTSSKAQTESTIGLTLPLL